jgi:hypothetical protein
MQACRLHFLQSSRDGSFEKSTTVTAFDLSERLLGKRLLFLAEFARRGKFSERSLSSSGDSSGAWDVP